MKSTGLAKKINFMREKLKMSSPNSVDTKRLPSKIAKLRSMIYNKDYSDPYENKGSEIEFNDKDFFLTAKLLDSNLEALSQIKAEHVNQGNQITPVNLPKLPFGSHSDYNHKQNFLENHIHNKDDENSDDLKKLDDIAKQLKVMNRKLKIKPGMKHIRKGRLSAMTNYHAYETNAGKLICIKQREIIGAYIEEKVKYTKKHNAYPFTQKYNQRFSPQNIKESRIKRARLCTERLSPTRGDIESSNSRIYEAKYPFLFNTSSTIC